MQKKLAIITIEDNLNYGNRLQNYAMQQLFVRHGFSVDTLGRQFRFVAPRRIALCKQKLKNVAIPILAALHIGGNLMSRRAGFLRFNRYIRQSQRKLNSQTDYYKLMTSYDVFVVGSDQIWNPNLYPTHLDVNMLTFVPPSKKIAVAPSVACDFLTPEQHEAFARNLSDFRYLSCREQRGSELIEDATGRHCETLVDPTLMIPVAEWNRLAKKPGFHREGQPYILTYFLGESERYDRLIREYAAQNGLRIIDLYDKNSRYYTCGPSEFLYLIRNCACMCTDSFHGSIFAYLYRRPLKILKRVATGVNGSMQSRLDNLVNTLQLNDVYMDEGTERLTFAAPNDHGDILAAEQARFNAYIDKVLKEIQL